MSDSLTKEEYSALWKEIKQKNPLVSKNTVEGIKEKINVIQQLREDIEGQTVVSSNRIPIVKRFYALGTLEKNLEQTRREVFRGNNQEKIDIFKDSKVPRSRFWGGGAGQFDSKIQDKSNEMLTVMLNDDNLWDGYWTNTLPGAPDTTRATDTPRDLDEDLSGLEFSSSDEGGEDEPALPSGDEPWNQNEAGFNILADALVDLTEENKLKVLKRQDEIFEKLEGQTNENEMMLIVDNMIKDITKENFVEDDSGGGEEPRIPKEIDPNDLFTPGVGTADPLFTDPITEQEPAGRPPAPFDGDYEDPFADIPIPQSLPPDDGLETPREQPPSRPPLMLGGVRRQAPQPATTPRNPIPTTGPPVIPDPIERETMEAPQEPNQYSNVEQQVGTRTQPSQIQGVLNNLDSGVLTEVVKRRREGLSINKLKADINSFHSIYDNVIPIFKNPDHIKRKNQALKSKDKRVVLTHYEEMENAISNFYKNDSGFKLGVIISAESLFSGSIFGNNTKDLQASGMMNAMGETPVDKSSFERGGIKSFSKTKVVEPTYTRGGIDHALGKPITGKMPKFKKKPKKGEANVKTIPTAVHRPYNHLLNRTLKPTNNIVIKGRKK